jgi:hypothetical protein
MAERFYLDITLDSPPPPCGKLSNLIGNLMMLANAQLRSEISAAWAWCGWHHHSVS